MKKTFKSWICSTKFRQILFLFAASYFLPVKIFAQGGFSSSSDVPDLPIDAGISLLVVAGVGYGIKKLLNKKVIDKK